MFEITEVEIDSENLTATVVQSEGSPVFTNEDLEATTKVFRLLPGVVEHSCMGDASASFKDVMGSTEVAHLLEHVVVELLAQASQTPVSAGRTRRGESEGTWILQFPCPDDVLVSAALSSGVWIVNWAFDNQEVPMPDIKGIVQGIKSLVHTI